MSERQWTDVADGPVPEPRVERDDSTVTRQQLSNVTSHRRTLQLAVALTVLHVYSNNTRTTVNTSKIFSTSWEIGPQTYFVV